MEGIGWCLTIVINIALRQVQCPEQNISYPIAIPRSDTNIKRGTWPIRDILFEPNAQYGNKLPISLIGPFVICLDIPGSNSCLHGSHVAREVNAGARVSSECYRMHMADIADLWTRTVMETTVIIK